MMQANLWAVVVSTLVYFGIGWLWYSAVFGKLWMSTLREEAKTAKFNPMIMVYGLLASFVTAYILSSVVNFAGAKTIVDGIMVGFFTWLGFVAAIMLNFVLYEKKSMVNYLINIGYYLVGLAVMGAILAVWK